MARISPGTMTAAIFAILVGLAGAYMVRQYLSHPEIAQIEKQAPELVYVPLASDDLIAGRELTINDIAVLSMTPVKFAESKYADQEFMTNSQQLTGRVLREPLKKGDVFLTTSLYLEGMGPGVAELLKPGQRAVTVAIQNVGAVEGFARPGTLVDVLYRSTPTETLPEITMTLLDRVEVLAVGTSSLPGQTVNVVNDKGSVTLAVTPEQAKAIKVVEGRGELTLALRNPDDAATLSSLGSGTRKMTLHSLLGLPDPRTATKKMDIYLGASKSTVMFNQGGDTQIHQPIGGSIQTPIASADPNPKSVISRPVVKSKFSTNTTTLSN